MSTTVPSLIRLLPLVLLMGFGPCGGDGKPLFPSDTGDPADPGDTEPTDDCDTASGDVVLSTWYADPDGDGYGNNWDAVEACAQPEGYVADNTDCAGADPARHPGATELCNGEDDDCDGEAEAYSTWYADDDRDGYGDPSDATEDCTAPDGYVADSSDCDDTASTANPGQAEVEADGVDNDCDGVVDESGSGSAGAVTGYFVWGKLSEEAVLSRGHHRWNNAMYYTVEGEWLEAEELCDGCEYGVRFTATYAEGMAEDNGWREGSFERFTTWPVDDSFSATVAFRQGDTWVDGYGSTWVLVDDTWAVRWTAEETTGGPWSSSYETWTDEPYGSLPYWARYGDGGFDMGVLYVQLPG